MCNLLSLDSSVKQEGNTLLLKVEAERAPLKRRNRIS